MITLCKLRDLGIVTNEGTLCGYNYTADQCAVIIKRIRTILAAQSPKEYLSSVSGQQPYPECIVRQIIRDLVERSK